MTQSLSEVADRPENQTVTMSVTGAAATFTVTVVGTNDPDEE